MPVLKIFGIKKNAILENKLKNRLGDIKGLKTHSDNVDVHFVGNISKNIWVEVELFSKNHDGTHRRLETIQQVSQVIADTLTSFVWGTKQKNTKYKIKVNMFEPENTAFIGGNLD